MNFLKIEEIAQAVLWTIRERFGPDRFYYQEYLIIGILKDEVRALCAAKMLRSEFWDEIRFSL
jgi:hypothetical protein